MCHGDDFVVNNLSHLAFDHATDLAAGTRLHVDLHHAASLSEVFAEGDQMLEGKQISGHYVSGTHQLKNPYLPVPINAVAVHSGLGVLSQNTLELECSVKFDWVTMMCCCGEKLYGHGARKKESVKSIVGANQQSMPPYRGPL